MNNYWKLSPIPLAFTGFLCYVNSVKAEQLPPCMDINLLQASVQLKSEEAVRYVKVYMPINIFKAFAEICNDRSLIRSSIDHKCYKPERLPRRVK